MTAPGRQSAQHPGIAAIVEHVAELLPAQGPLSVFIHHNPLHALEDRPFESAVVEAGRRFGYESLLPEALYRKEFASGRIADVDVVAVLAELLGARGQEMVAGLTTRADLQFRLARYGSIEVDPAALRWVLHELDTLERFRSDLPADARQSLALGPHDSVAEGSEVRALWHASVGAALRAGDAPLAAPVPRWLRHRDGLLEAFGVDIDEWIHPILIRFAGAYLDQGLARWSLAGRSRGLYSVFTDVYGGQMVRLCGVWAAGLCDLIAEDRDHQRGPLASVSHSLQTLGVEEGEHFEFLLATSLALRGWAGMIAQIF